MEKEQSGYFKFTGKSRLDKSINSLLGIVEGISADSKINSAELSFLNHWMNEHREVATLHPFNELIPVVTTALADGVLSEEEHQDIRWLCERLTSSEFYDGVTAKLQRLHAIVGGIASDARVTEEELRELSDWLADHDQLKSCWPYDEIDSLVTKVMSDGRIDETEHVVIQRFFSEFVTLFDERTIVSPLLNGESVVGLCAVCPEIRFIGSTFCFTGASSRHSRTEFAEIVQRLGGSAVSGVAGKLNYLVIGADGNPCWSYACYGRKVEKAVELRKQGKRIVIVHENDFHDAVLDCK